MNTARTKQSELHNNFTAVVMSDTRRLKDQYREKHPGFENYLECMTRAFLAGLSGFTLGLCLSSVNLFRNSIPTISAGFASVYFSQKLVQRRYPYPLKYSILISTLVGTTASYKITSDRTKSCQSGWLAAEDKHTALDQE